MNFSRFTITVGNEGGLHMRPAARIIEDIKKLDLPRGAKVIVHNGPKNADAKSILRLLLLEASKGTELQIELIGVIDGQRGEIMKIFDDTLGPREED